MPTTIRLQRVGRKKQASFRIVVSDAAESRDGPTIETIGLYNPRTHPSAIRVDAEAALRWLYEGAQPSETVVSIFRKAGVWQRFQAGHTADELEESIVVLGPPPGEGKTSFRARRAAEAEALQTVEREEAAKLEREAAKAETVTEEAGAAVEADEAAVEADAPAVEADATAVVADEAAAAAETEAVEAAPSEEPVESEAPGADEPSEEAATATAAADDEAAEAESVVEAPPAKLETDIEEAAVAKASGSGDEPEEAEAPIEAEAEADDKE